MRLLAITNLYPTRQAPTLGVFVERQVEGLRRIGLNVEVLVIDRASGGRWAYWTVGRRLRAAIRTFKPDIVHVMYGGITASLVTLTVEHLPVVVSFCGSDLLGFSSPSPLTSLSARCGVLASHGAARRARGIVVKSNNLRERLPRDIDRARVRVIPNGIDLRRFRRLDREACRSRLNWATDRFHVLFADNNGNPCKRPALARAAVQTLAHRGIDAELHQLSGVAPDDVPIWLNASHALLLTSVSEGSPNIVKEALACDVPVVSVDVGDVRERIQGIDGCFIASPHPSELAARMQIVHSGPARVPGSVKMQELSLENVALRLAHFYDELIGARGVRGCIPQPNGSKPRAGQLPNAAVIRQ
jgi:glycosyltransferase involved in cell wall biosynthesis